MSTGKFATGKEIFAGRTGALRVGYFESVGEGPMFIIEGRQFARSRIGYCFYLLSFLMLLGAAGFTMHLRVPPKAKGPSNGI